MSAQSEQRRMMQGMLLACAGYAVLTVGDSVVKTMAGQFPGPAVAALRYILGTVGLVAILWWRQGRAGFSFPKPAVQWGRALGVSVSAVCFFVGVQLMPLAEMTAISFTGPIIVAIMSAIFLKEPAPRATWIAAIAAFTGMLMVLRPNIAELGWAALLPTLSAIGFSSMIICNRLAAGSGSMLLMQVLISVLATPILVAFAMAGHLSGWPALAIPVPDWTIVGRCAVVAITGSAAHGLLFLAAERVSTARTAPLSYVQLLVALVLGVLVFNEWPDLMALVGAVIIIGSGLFLWRKTALTGS